MVDTALAPALLHACEIAAAAAISVTWQAALLALSVALCFQLLPTLPAAVRSATWTAVLAVSVLLPFASAATMPSARTNVDAASVLQLDPRWSLAFVGLWLSLSAVRAAGLLSSAFRLRRIRRRATPVTAISPLISNHLGRHCAAVLCTSNDVARPSVLGFFRPRILVPSDLYARLSPVDLQQIVLHEKEHLRRRDDWTNLLQKIALVVFPLNLALLWVERRLCLERELACDEGVLRATRSPRNYATCLVNLAQDRAHARQISLALEVWGRRSELTRRIHGILQLHRMQLRGETMDRRHVATFTSLLITGLVAGSAALARSPQIVSFTAAATSREAPISASVAPELHYSAASFTDAAPTKPRLVDAVIRTHSNSNIAKATTAKRRAHTTTSIRRADERLSAMQERLLLSSWDQVKAPRSATYRARRTSFAVVTRSWSSFSYAAVRTPDGWLIVQL